MNGKEHDNPHAVFEALRKTGKKVVLLESGTGRGKWSFVGVINEKIKVPLGEAGLRFMREFFREKNCEKGGYERKPSDPPFRCGFVGFLSYDLGEQWMGVSRKNGVQKTERCPKAYFVYVDEVIAFPWQGRRASPNRFSKNGRTPKKHIKVASFSNLTFKQYCQKIAKIKDYLYSGHTYQVNFSQRFKIPYYGDAFKLYKKVAVINPSPFQFFLETQNFAIISNSPERLFCMTPGETGMGMVIETRPIKGTMPRGKNKKEDKKNIKKLLANEKEKAELTMIVDLERNDIGKICKPGTVEVTEERTLEKYSHVIHTVSNVRGTVEEKYDWYDVLHALFPGGSITGCPKKRTMEIIAKLEKYPRGIYSGSAGFIDISGACDFNIMIRTLWLPKNKKDVKITFNSGGGIVANSKAENEYEETLHKAAALLDAIVK